MTVEQASSALSGEPFACTAAHTQTLLQALFITPNLFGLYLASCPLANLIVNTGWEVVRVFIKFTFTSRNCKSTGDSDMEPCLEFRSPVLIHELAAFVAVFTVSLEIGNPPGLLFER